MARSSSECRATPATSSRCEGGGCLAVLRVEARVELLVVLPVMEFTFREGQGAESVRASLGRVVNTPPYAGIARIRFEGFARTVLYQCCTGAISLRCRASQALGHPRFTAAV